MKSERQAVATVRSAVLAIPVHPNERVFVRPDTCPRHDHAGETDREDRKRGTKGIASIAVVAGMGVLDFGFPRPDVTIASRLTFCRGDNAGLDHDGFEDAVRPTKSNQIRSSPVSSADVMDTGWCLG